MNDLRALRQWCEDHRVPCITPATEDFLRTYIEKKKPRYIGEIGSAVGYSGIMMAQCIQPRNGHLWSIEYSLPDYQRACENAQVYNQNNVTFYHADANIFDYNTVCSGEKVDIMYIDGRKRDYLTYFQRIIDIVTPDATVIFDDVIKFAHKTISLYEYLDEKQIHYEIFKLDPDDGIMVIENAGEQAKKTGIIK